MKKSSLLISWLLCVSLFSNAQQDKCFLIKDTFCLITLDIRVSGENPIIMNGVTNKNILQNLEKGSIDFLLESFYKNAYYVPAISSGVTKMIVECMNDSSGYNYLKEHAMSLAQLSGKIKSKSLNKKFKLKSGETVFVSIAEIGGSFWKVNKDHPGISKTSNEKDISTIEQIQVCYVPFEINYLKKSKSYKQ